MRLGIDLGTTRTLVAACDRGNYPLVTFQTAAGDGAEHVPTVSAEEHGELVHGWRAEEAAIAGAPHLRSWKRLLARHGPEHRVRIGRVELSLMELATSFLAALRQEIVERSSMPRKNLDAVQAVVSVPANAHSSQRWATLEAFGRAGFEVAAMLNEPSAADIEFAHRHKSALNRRREHVAVYDLGGGTFDAALVSMAGERHDVVSTAGVQELGGDDFDRVLLDMAIERTALDQQALEAFVPAFLSECRAAKEGIGNATRRVVLELAALGGRAPPPIVLSVADYYERLRPLVDRTLAALAEVMQHEGDAADLAPAASEAGVAGVYVVGGASALPLVTRHLRERLGRRVHRSPHPAGSTAMGLAIAAETEGPALTHERFTRHLGVFREAALGEKKTFDRIFARGTPMPSNGDTPLVATRVYRAAHNIGQLRFVECGSVTATGEPEGDISPHATVYFPYHREARDRPVESVGIARLDGRGPLIEERYEVDSAGVVAVTIRDLEDGYSRRFVL